jgi:hypothetical protein
LKKNFETTTGAKRPQETVKKALVGTVAKASGITPVLKDVDTAIEKKERKPLEQALNKLMVARSAYCTFLSQEQKKYNPMQDDTQQAVWAAYRDLIMGVQKIESDAADQAKTLQETKGAGQAIQFFALEGDVKGTVVAAKKGLAPYAALDKKYNLLKASEGAVRQAEAYTKAAARTQVKEAIAALQSFKDEAKKCYEALAKVLPLEKDAGFLKALQAYHDAMKALASVGRVDAQIKNLKAMGQAG